MTRLKLLGGFALTASGQAVRLGYRASELIARLAIEIERPAERKRVAADLWPFVEPQKASFYLRRLLLELRGQLGQSPEIFRTPERGKLELAGLSCDLWDFQRAVATGQWTKALDLFAGPLVPSSEALWLVPHREKLTEKCLLAIEALADELADQGEVRKAAAYLRQAVELDPVSERLRCKLMRLLAQGGDSPAALQEYERYRGYLGIQLDLPPGPEAIRLASAIRTESRKPRNNQSSSTLEFSSALPHPATPLIGRRDLLSQLVAVVGCNRLTTLLGPGGVGKTRLSIAVAEHLMSKFRDGVWFCDLSSTSQSEHIWHVVATTLRVDLSRDPKEAAILALQNCNLLIVLDNCEHLIDAAAEVADTLLSRFPDVTILSTSREPLQLVAEQLIPIPTMTIGGESIDMFYSVACRANPALQRIPEDLDAVKEICRLVDGLPLGVELAASHIRTMSIDRLLETTRGDLSKLRLTRRRHVRQHSLDAAVDWSYKLLNETEKFVLRSCGIAYGSMSLEALAAVTQLPVNEVEHHVFSLRDRSLIHSLEDDRVRLLETIRQFAARKQQSLNEEDKAWARFVEWLARIGVQNPDSRPTLSPELPMARAALEWCRASVDRNDLGLEMLIGLNRVWGFFPTIQASIAQYTEFAENSASSELKFTAYSLIANCHRDLGQIQEAELALLKASDCMKDVTTDARIGHYCNVKGTLHLSKHELEQAIASLRKADECFSIADHAVLRAHNLIWLAKASDAKGESEKCIQFARESQVIFSGRGFRGESATAMLVEGRCEFRRGNVGTAASLFQEALSIYLAGDDHYQAAHAYVCLGLAKLNRGDPDGAEHIVNGHDIADNIDIDRSLLYEGMVRS